MLDEAVEKLNVVDRLAGWQQGDFTLDCSDFLFCTRPMDDEEDGASFSAGIESDHIGVCVISQTCDIVRDPDGSGVSYVTVCPVVKINASHMSAVGKGEVPRFGMLTGAPKNAVVDFTRAMSVKKDLLVEWANQRGCPTESDLTNFARALERFYGRFGFPDAFNMSMDTFRIAVNKRYGKPNSEFGKAIRSVSEFRVFPYTSWNNSDDVPITILAILKEPNNREVEEVADIREALEEQVAKIVWTEPFSAHKKALRVASLEDLTAAEYLNTYPLELNALSFSQRYQQG